MKTNAELETLIQNLIERMNRIEIMQAIQTKPAVEKITIDLDTSAVTKCIQQIETALREIEARKPVTLNGK